MANSDIKEEWKEYYETLEKIRESGITNMFEAAPYLEEECGIDEKLALDILANWMVNYSKLANKYGWRN